MDFSDFSTPYPNPHKEPSLTPRGDFWYDPEVETKFPDIPEVKTEKPKQRFWDFSNIRNDYTSENMGFISTLNTEDRTRLHTKQDPNQEINEIHNIIQHINKYSLHIDLPSIPDSIYKIGPSSINRTFFGEENHTSACIILNGSLFRYPHTNLESRNILFWASLIQGVNGHPFPYDGKIVEETFQDPNIETDIEQCEQWISNKYSKEGIPYLLYMLGKTADPFDLLNLSDDSELEKRCTLFTQKLISICPQFTILQALGSGTFGFATNFLIRNSATSDIWGYNSNGQENIFKAIPAQACGAEYELDIDANRYPRVTQRREYQIVLNEKNSPIGPNGRVMRPICLTFDLELMLTYGENYSWEGKINLCNFRPNNQVKEKTVLDLLEILTNAFNIDGPQVVFEKKEHPLKKKKSWGSVFRK